MFRRKLLALEFKGADNLDINDEQTFRELVVWLEDQKIRHYRIEDRAKLRQTQDADWDQALKHNLKMPVFENTSFKTERAAEELRKLSHRRSSVAGDLLPPSGDLSEPSPRSNLSNFHGADQYFTILFEHYREDFTGELRKAIKEFRRSHQQILFPRGTERPVIEGGHYFQVLNFHSYDLTVSMADYRTLQKDFQWNRSEHLKTNALVALSNDCFNSWTYAVVVGDGRPDRRNRMNQNNERYKGFRKQRVITVQPYQGATLDHLRVGSLWIIDPDSYFESYRPVLERIRQVQEDRSLLPFKEYIIDKSLDVSRPQYLDYEDAEASVAGFDESQKEALHHALSHEVALIQGAPGTGKTHLGVNLVRIISSLETPPKIVIISFTNHAVDNFVLECERVGVNVCGLVRMGGQYCQDMAKFSLETRKNQWRRGVPDVLMRANIIAMTTTGGAKYQSLMEQVQPEVVLVEEAAHITEAHLIAALPSSCRHLILLGDYWQLKPHITEHAKKFLLDVSLFERLIRVGLPSAELELQYRMHPDLTSVMVPHIYPTLDSVQTCSYYPSVKGVPTRVVFFTHESEDEVKDELTTKSRINDFERDFLCRFCQYLLLQGHKESSITILSTYKEQVHAIFDALKVLKIKVTDETSQKKQERNNSRRSSTASSTGEESATGGVRVATVDAFQGEQNDIVLVSFVASSATAFLDINRVSAALSCARQGFYAMGNFDAYRRSAGDKLAYHLRKEAHYAEADALGRCRAHNVQLWPLLYDQWIDQKVLRSYLPILCEKHGKTQIIQDASSFDIYSPEGGCQSQCTERSCAHLRCARHCHPDDKHSNPCSQLLTVVNKGVRTPKTCDQLKTYRWQGTEMVEMSFPKCNHKRLVSHVEVFTAQCVEKTSRCRPGCGHSETVNCGEPFSDNCLAKVTVSLDLYDCQHRYSVSCFRNTPAYLTKVAQQCEKMAKFTCTHCENSLDVECNSLFRTKCQKTVLITLDCGHSKSVICYSRNSASAQRCEEMVTLALDCSHNKSVMCCTKDSATARMCVENVTLTLDCGHSKTVKCREKASDGSRTCITLLTRVARPCGHSISSVYCRRKRRELRQPCQVTCTKRPTCGHTVTYACYKKSEYERDDYRCTTFRTLKRSCGHEQSVLCCVFAAMQTAPCRAKVTTGFLFWKKRYECHDYQRLNPR